MLSAAQHDKLRLANSCLVARYKVILSYVSTLPKDISTVLPNHQANGTDVHVDNGCTATIDLGPLPCQAVGLHKYKALLKLKCLACYRAGAPLADLDQQKRSALEQKIDIDGNKQGIQYLDMIASSAKQKSLNHSLAKKQPISEVENECISYDLFRLTILE